MPEYNESIRLDPGQVQDVRGRGMGAPIAIGGGGIGLLLLLLSLVLGVNPLDQGAANPYEGLRDQTDGAIAQECQTGQDAARREDCRIVLFVNSIQDHWSTYLRGTTVPYEPAKTQFFSGFTQTACGTASSDVGPFYCPLDRMIYIDLGFFQELRSRFGARGGDFAQAYVIAHEYGHHVQNLLGTLEAAQSDRQGPESAAVRTELQADCFAGVWANRAISTGYITRLDDQDIADSLSAAAAVGDDRIQRSATGRVNPETWTHGSSEQRQRWFGIGYRTGDIRGCDTFSGDI